MKLTQRLRTWIASNTDNRYIGNMLSWLGLMYWPLDEKLPLRESIYKAWRRPLSGRVGWLHVFGGVSLFLVLLLAITGVLMTFHYQPSPEIAHDSIAYIMADVSFGWLIRGVHYWAAHLLLALVLFHVVRTFFSRAYRAPRQLNWIIGLLILPVLIGLLYTGELLPWDQIAYWKSVRGSEIRETIPLIGTGLSHVSGGTDVSSLTLMRYFIMHILVLPWILFGLLNLHLRLVRKFGLTPRRGKWKAPGHRSMVLVLNQSTSIEDQDAIVAKLEQHGCRTERIQGTEKRLLRVDGASLQASDALAANPAVEEIVRLEGDTHTTAFFPRHLFRVIVAMLLAGGILLLLAAFLPPLLGERHDPFVRPEHVEPSWYLMWFSKLQELVPAGLGFLPVLLFFLVPLLAIFWPLLDTDVEDRRRYPWLAPLVGVLAVAFYVGLTLWGMLS